MVKNYSFYQFVMTVRGRKDDKGKLAEQIFDDLAFRNMKMTLIHFLNTLKRKANLLCLCLF